MKGAAAAGIVTIGVGKTPGKNEFFRTHLTFRPVVQMVDVEIGMEKTYFAVSPGMVEPLAFDRHHLFPAYAVSDNHVAGSAANYSSPLRRRGRHSERIQRVPRSIGLISAMKKWKRLFTDTENACYRVFPAPEDRFPDPLWPDELKPAKIFRLAFRDRGRLIDSPQHELFQRWAARDKPE